MVLPNHGCILFSFFTFPHSLLITVPLSLTLSLVPSSSYSPPFHLYGRKQPGWSLNVQRRNVGVENRWILTTNISTSAAKSNQLLWFTCCEISLCNIGAVYRASNSSQEGTDLDCRLGTKAAGGGTVDGAAESCWAESFFTQTGRQYCIL